MAGPKKQAHNLLRWPVIVLLAASLLWTSMAFSYRFANYQPEQDITARLPFLPAVSRFQIGQISEQAAFDRIFPAYDQALRAINSEEQSLIYRVGTYMPFFIRKNDRRLFTDNFLDFFENLSRKYPDKNTLAEVLKTNGFRYIIVDLNLVINDQTPEQVLRGRFEHFINTLYGNANLELIATDRQIRAPGSDQVFNAVFIPEGTITIPGTFAVYRIK